MRPTLVVLTFALLPAASLKAQAATEYECGAEAPARVGLVVQYVKHLPDGHAERGPATAVGQWGRTFIPDVSLGPVLHGFTVLFENASSGDHYVRMAITVEENHRFFWTSIREGRTVEPGDDVGVTVSIGRKGPDGQYVWVREKEYWVPSLDRIDELRPMIEAELDQLHHFMITNLLPLRVTYKVTWHVYDVEEPVGYLGISSAPFLSIEGMEDAFGPIVPHATQRSFCFNLRFAHYDGTERPSKFAVDEKEFWLYPLDEVMEYQAEKACEPREGYCSRPESQVIPYLTKGFGIFWDNRLEAFGDYDQRPITWLCPLDIAPPDPDTLLLGAPERRTLAFKVTGMDGMPIPGVDLKVTRTVSPDLGTVSPQSTRTNGFGEPDGLAIATRDDAPSDLADQVEVAACRDTPPDQLGHDESGRPIPWNDEAVQPVKIQAYPVVEVELRAVHKLDRSEDQRVERSTEVSQEVSRTETDQTLELRFQVGFNEREVKEGYRDGSGFRGTLIQYRGTAAARVGLASLEPSKETVSKSGYYQDRDCGRLTFDFTPWSNTYTFRQTAPVVPLLVLYQHFIPDEASPVQRHPREGLSFVQQVPAPFLTFTPRSTSVDMNQEGCGLDFETMRFPAMQVPLLVNEAFPILLAPYADDCYGIEQVTVPLKEEEYMSALLRKWDPVTRDFDKLEHTVRIDLGRNQQAECWDIPEDDSVTRYVPEGTWVRGLYSIFSEARLVGGNFDFRVTPRR